MNREELDRLWFEAMLLTNALPTSSPLPSGRNVRRCVRTMFALGAIPAASPEQSVPPPSAREDRRTRHDRR